MARAMEEVEDDYSWPGTPTIGSYPGIIVSAPPSQLHSPSMSRSPLLQPSTPKSAAPTTPITPKTPRTPAQFLTPLASPLRKAAATMKDYLEDVGHLTRLNPEDDWLPITESRKGNAYYAAFHTLCAGIGFQALLLPVAFSFLGWAWGAFSLSAVFIWQLYALWILTQLHEPEPGVRYGRYLQLATKAFGEKMGNAAVKFPIMYLSAGICTTLIIIGGGSLKLFHDILCGPQCQSKPLTTIEWYLVFTCLAVVISQLPNLNSIAGVSLVGSVTAVAYCTIIWVLSLAKGRPNGVSYSPVEGKSEVERFLGVLNGLGIIAFAFRGHNLVLEIQATMPSTEKHPSRVPMWRGVRIASATIAACLFPVAIAGYWTYGNLIPSGGILAAIYMIHGGDTSKGLLGLTSMLVVISCLCAFQIYGMPMFDIMEAGYAVKKRKPCPRWLRSGMRVLFGGISFLIGVAFPFLSDMASLIGGLALPVALAYPCFMWVIIKKPKKWSLRWSLNMGLGFLGIALSVLLVVAAVWSIVIKGIKFRFFRAS